MKKLRLNLDALVVETFAAISPAGHAAGTVGAHQQAGDQAGDAAEGARCAASGSCPPEFPDQRPA